ncbi:MAG: hypothetical protein PHX12_06070 [Proteiniphilum sp.]|nr:hypothetical protein [Proteiniphilum sp.]
MFDTILSNIDKMQAIIVALSALIGAIVTLVITGIREYKRIRKEIAAEEFKEIAAPFSKVAETQPMKVLANLINPPIDSLPTIANSNEGKALIVGQAAIEKAQKEKPSLLKKLGINSAADAVPLVSSLYKLIKPLVKK